MKNNSTKSKMLLNQWLMFTDKDLKKKNIIIWLWFIWSNLAFALMKTWFENFILVDYDKVEEKNLLNQMYVKQLVWLNKATALSNILLSTAKEWVWIPVFAVWKNIKWENYLDELLKDKVENTNIFVSTDNLSSKQNMIEKLTKNIWKIKNTTIFVAWANWEWMLLDTIYIKDWKEVLKDNEKKQELINHLKY